MATPPFTQIASPMRAPLERTFETLARADDPAGEELLLAALGRDDQLGIDALLAIGRVGPLRLKHEVLRRGERLSAPQKQAVREQTRYFSDAARHGLTSRNEAERVMATRWVAEVSDFDRYPDLIGHLKSASADELPSLTQAIDGLTKEMFDHIDGRTSGRPDGYQLRNARDLRDRMYRALLTAVETIADQPCPGPLLEWTWVLTDAEGSDVENLIGRVPATHRAALYQTLHESIHPGVMRLPMELLKRPHPFSFVADLWKHRADEPFVHHVLRTFPDRLTDTQLENVRLVKKLPWLEGGEDGLQEVPLSHREGLARLVTRFGLPDERKRGVLKWLLDNGDAGTQKAASEGFRFLTTEERQAAVRKSVYHTDSRVRVWAVQNLRAHEVPDAHRILVETLETGDAAVRDAARTELSDINLARAAEMLQKTPARVTPEFGDLLRKIHPDLTLDLRRDLVSPVRQRRITAARLAAALGLAKEVEAGLIALVEDQDMVVRRSAIESLANVPTRQAVQTVRAALDDESARVREAAAESLRRLLASPATASGPPAATREDRAEIAPAASPGPLTQVPATEARR